MTEDKFWETIALSKEGTHGSQDAQEARLRDILDRLEATEIASFDRIFDELRAKSYRNDLWGAAYLINGGCSDDGFEYFRRALIAEGRDKFELAIEDPDSLSSWLDEETEFEGIYHVARAAYKAKTGGNDLPESGVVFPKEPIGPDWEEDELEELFPRIAKKFGNS